MGRVWLVPLAIVGLSALVGCPEDDACVDGRQVACACPGGAVGAQVCRQGSFGPCVCRSRRADASVDAGLADAAGSDASLDATADSDATATDSGAGADSEPAADAGADGGALPDAATDAGAGSDGGVDGGAVADGGFAGAPPVLEVRCLRGGGHCGDIQTAPTAACVSAVFGSVHAGAAACDLRVDIANLQRGGQRTAALLVESIEIWVYEIQDPTRQLVDGRSVGFSLIDAAGAPLHVDAGNPLVVEIPAGQSSGASQVAVRYDGTTPGIWRGDGRMGSGLILHSNDPDQPVKAISLSALGSAPQIDVLPRSVRFGPVAQGQMATESVSIQNTGDADLVITAVRTTSAEFSATNSAGAVPFTVPPFTSAVTAEVTYQPMSAGPHWGSLVIESNDAPRSPLTIPLSGGAVPRVEVEPTDTLVFALGVPPPRRESLIVRNVGFGDLVILELDVVGPGGDPSHPSVDDFSVAGCAAYPCALNTTLCAPMSAGCVSSAVTFEVTYSNNDASATDLAELRIVTNDPADPSHIVVLSARSTPCLFPTPVITVETVSPTAGQVVTVNATSSVPGAGTLVAYQWQWLFTPGTPPPFSDATAVRTTFTPSVAGSHVLGLHVTNSCGSTSQVPASEAITVAP